MASKRQTRSAVGTPAQKNFPANNPPRFQKLAEKILSHEEALSELSDFIATLSQGGQFAPRDDVLVRLQIMQNAMTRETALLSQFASSKKGKRA